ncbi:hypothetical protein BARBAKC583_0807 [Bartonella bacilliformis KC583]|uniref:Uncharacterized protein n=1 Tax=Bartonella bacilliformis (strain ATCC 35685 / KC583 / Herrer 020/F12,63) TaxID=360095 RepID=A1USZ4_BARBK|nr:hypothetical protein BARBAKC583_0807 [Bartonella bacilliformis KC583]
MLKTKNVTSYNYLDIIANAFVTKNTTNISFQNFIRSN